MGALLGFAFALLFCSTSCVNAEAPVMASANEGSILRALLESHYSEWMELVERAQMLHPLEQLVGCGLKLTIFAPQNHQMNPEIKAFLLKPPNSHLLKKMVQHHVLRERIALSQWHLPRIAMSLADESVALRAEKERDVDNVKLYVGEAEIVASDFIVRDDGIIHGVDQMILPMSVQQSYVAFSTRSLAIPLPTGAPALDTRRIMLDGEVEDFAAKIVEEKQHHHAPAPMSFAPVGSPVSAPAPGPSVGPSVQPVLFLGSGSFGDKEVETFVMALSRFGGYTEFSGLLVDLTSLGYEVAKLVNWGRKLTILSPDNNAWKEAALTEEQLSSPTEITNIMKYHIIMEYQTEESLYTTVRRRGKTGFNTLAKKLLYANEADGLVVFGEGSDQAGVFDHDIFADGKISVQGINKVLFPPTAETTTTLTGMSGRSVLEMLQLPSKASVRNSGPRRTVTTAAPFAAVVSIAALLLINFTA